MKKLFLGVALLAAGMILKAQTADEIVTKHITAIGGQENLGKIENIIMEGNLDLGGNAVNLKIIRVKDKLARQEINLMGVTGYDLTTDKEGWIFLPFLGQSAPVQKSADELKASQEELNVADPVCQAQAKGNKIEMMGKEDVNGVECYKLKIDNASSDGITCYIDPTTFYLVRVIEVKKVMGQSMTTPVDFSNYKDVNGIKMAYTMSTPQGNMTFTSIKANQTIEDKAYLH